jgi:hypothetical protein
MWFLYGMDPSLLDKVPEAVDNMRPYNIYLWKIAVSVDTKGLWWL